jgi:hypothetical protein
VQEYVSYDFGLIRLLDDDRSVVLFSVEQVVRPESFKKIFRLDNIRR